MYNTIENEHNQLKDDNTFEIINLNNSDEVIM